MNFYIDVGNNGPDVSEDTKLTFSDNIFDLTFESVSFSKGGMDEALPVWNIGTLEVGEEATIDFEGILNETGEDITLTATISGSNFDSNLEDNVLVKIIEKSSHPAGFVIKTRDGVVAEIEGPGDVLETGISVYADGHIDGRTFLEEVISWPEEKPDWLEGDGVKFYDSGFLTKVPDTVPAWITDMSLMFRNCKITGDVSGWDTSNVTNMSEMFYGCSTFNQDLSGWDVSNVTNMSSMFSGCQSFNGDISGWDISNVTNMSNMFSNCYVFNQDISGWDISNVTYIYSMFRECQNFNQDISGWDMSNVTNMASMFSGCRSFNQDISGWDTSNVTDMSRMFSACRTFNQDLSGWCVSKISREPNQFATSTDSWTLPKPIWGTCPQEDSGGGGGITPPNIGEYWTGQGGYYAGIVTTKDLYGVPIAEFYSIVSDKEADVEAIWSNDTSITHYLEDGADGDGLINTQTILNSGVIEQCPAFSHCVNYTRDGHSDFYLGSSGEYSEIRRNLLGQTDLPNPFIDGTQSFENTWYWGSSDWWSFRVTEARVIYFGTGAFGYCIKNKVRNASYDDPTRVRPIRRIPIS